MDTLKLKALIAKNGLTQKDLSTRAGIAPVNLSFLLRGKVKPRLSTIGKLAKALNVDVRELLEE